MMVGFDDFFDFFFKAPDLVVEIHFFLMFFFEAPRVGSIHAPLEVGRLSTMIYSWNFDDHPNGGWVVGLGIPTKPDVVP